MVSFILPVGSLLLQSFKRAPIPAFTATRPSSFSLHPRQSNYNAGQLFHQRTRSTIGRIPILSRTIPIHTTDSSNCLNVTIWEMEAPSQSILSWYSADRPDPFGVVMWPGSIVASMVLMEHCYNYHKNNHHHHHSRSTMEIQDSTVLVLGAGTGVEAMVAGLLGAKRVIATDVNEFTLDLLEYAAALTFPGESVVQGKLRRVTPFAELPPSQLSRQDFNVTSDDSLLPCDILIAADVLYNPILAHHIGRRVHEAITRSLDADAAVPKILITDSQQFHGTDFLVELEELNERLGRLGLDRLEWEDRELKNVCTSGVVIEEDQVYDVTVRVLSWGWERAEIL